MSSEDSARYRRRRARLSQAFAVVCLAATSLCVLALAVLLVQMTASRLLWPQAGRPPYGLELRHLFEHWPALLAVGPLCIAMLSMDLWGFIVVGAIDRSEMEKYFDQAESWLGWRGPLVRALTLGMVNPQKIVDEEVRKSLTEMQTTLTASMWWVILQTLLRLGFGLTLWTVWAFHG